MIPIDPNLLAEVLMPLEYHRINTIPKHNGKSPNRSTVWRWATRGILGRNRTRIRLAVIYIGRVPHTSIEGIRRFLSALTEAKLPVPSAKTESQSPRDESTIQKLKSLGLIK